MLSIQEIEMMDAYLEAQPTGSFLPYDEAELSATDTAASTAAATAASPPPMSDGDSPGGEWFMEAFVPEPKSNQYLAVAKITKAKPLKHSSLVSTYQHLFPGRLTAVPYGGLRFIPSIAVGMRPLFKYNPIGSRLSTIGVKSRKDLDEARRYLSYNQTGTPRLLLRGFHSGSGGGGHPSLNGPMGVVPHFFLDWLYEIPTNMWDSHRWRSDLIFNLRRVIECHLLNADFIKSPFSSWSHDPLIAFLFARCGYDSSMIAVLDTSSLAERVWFTEDLDDAGLTPTSFDCEYLIYGPVSGPNYHCVSFPELVRTTRIHEIEKGLPWSFGNDRVSSIEREAVEASREIATFLQPQGAGLDKILMLTAKFVGVRAVDNILIYRWLSYPEVEAFLYWVRDDLQGLAMRDDARSVSLVEPLMSTSATWALEYEIQMLQAAENAVHVLGWVWVTGISTFIDTYRKQMGLGPAGTEETESGIEESE